MLKASIVGCGAIARHHAAAIKASEGAALISVADIKPERADRFAREFGAKPYYSLDELLAGEAGKPDVVHICTPHYTHAGLAVKALESGCNVLLEKPVAMNPEDIAVIARAVEKSGRQLAVCFQNRYKQTSRAAKEMIETKRYGGIRGARGLVTWNRDAAYYKGSDWRGRWATEGGGVMINQAIHTLDLMLWLCGDPKSVEGHIANHHLKGVIEVEDTAEMYLDFGGGVHGSFFATTAYSGDAPVFLEIDCERAKIILEGEDLYVRGREGQLLCYLANTGSQSDDKPCWGDDHKSLIADFYDCIQSGRPFPIGAQEGGRALRALKALYASSAGGRIVEL